MIKKNRSCTGVILQAIAGAGDYPPAFLFVSLCYSSKGKIKKSRATKYEGKATKTK